MIPRGTVINPTLSELINNLRADQSVDPASKTELFEAIDKSKKLPIWSSVNLEKLETPLGDFVLTGSLRKQARKLLLNPVADSQILLEVKNLLTSESSRIAKFISLVAQSENKLGLKEYETTKNPNHIEFETGDGNDIGDGYHFISHAGDTELHGMAKRNLSSDLNITGSNNIKRNNKFIQRVVHGDGSNFLDSLPPHDASEIDKTLCFPEDNKRNSLSLMSGPNRVSLVESAA